MHAFLIILFGLSPQLSTPERRAFEADMAAYSAETARLSVAANTASNAEAKRETILSCTHADNTPAYTECLLHEARLTDVNYKAVLSALRAILALPVPRGPGMPEKSSGPSGPIATPAANTAALDAAEAAWHTYADAECNAVDTEWRGGTIVNAKYHECTVRVVRARLRELASAYDQFLQP